MFTPAETEGQSSSLPTTFVPSNVTVYAKHSVGLWQPTHPTIFIIMKSISRHPTVSLSNQSVEPVAHCPTLEAAYQAIEALTQQHPSGILLKDPDWGWFQIPGEKVTHTFWVEEVGHSRVLKWMDFRDEAADDWTTSDGTTNYIATSDGIVFEQQKKGVNGGTYTHTSNDGHNKEPSSNGGLGHVFVWMLAESSNAETTAKQHEDGVNGGTEIQTSKDEHFKEPSPDRGLDHVFVWRLAESYC
ncbi:hypothetical protein N0V95_003567 [Ascochyta clinopodiicola]|nr:hypothetical protein N0V95_003567 [Ascochyta clinopodiicola]